MIFFQNYFRYYNSRDVCVCVCVSRERNGFDKERACREDKNREGIEGYVMLLTQAIPGSFASIL